MPTSDEKKNTVIRPPIIVIMGHIDHGKSTLLDYIRKTNIVAKEAGGITQHLSAYEVKHAGQDGRKRSITFLDTPGHEAFRALRERGTKVADIAVLVVSAEDGVKKQTLEALSCIKRDELPYIVAINKIDKPTANIERTKQSLAENEIYVEGYGGTVPAVQISAKSGEGVNELLDMMLLLADLEDLKGNPKKPAEGIVIESNIDPKKGIAATLIIQDGSLKKGEYLVSEDSVAPTRLLENFAGKPIKEASLGAPVRIIGWSKIPTIGGNFVACKTKKEAEGKVLEWRELKSSKTTESPNALNNEESDVNIVTIPIIIKADMAGSVEAIAHEITKMRETTIEPVIVLSGVGNVSESDIKRALSHKNSLVVSFHTGIDAPAAALAERSGITIRQFDVIYKLTETIAAEIANRRPKVETIETIGRAKILKIFSASKNRQIIGGKVEMGSLKNGGEVKIMRRENEIGSGIIKELQSQKLKTGEVEEGKEFGAMVESKTEIAPGDKLELSIKVQK